MPRKRLASSATWERSTGNSNPQPAFFKELALVITVQGKPELIHFAAGFSKEVDPQSGMTINLKDILEWLDQWKQQSATVDFLSWTDFLSQAHRHFSSQAASLQALLKAVQAQFFDQTTMRWNGSELSVLKKAPIVDSLARLRVCSLLFQAATESDVQRLREFTMPSDLPGSFDETEFFVTFFESKLGLPVIQAELQDPQTKVSVVFP